MKIKEIQVLKDVLNGNLTEENKKILAKLIISEEHKLLKKQSEVNKELHKKLSAEYYEKNKELVKQKRRERYKKSKEKNTDKKTISIFVGSKKEFKEYLEREVNENDKESN